MLKPDISIHPLFYDVLSGEFRPPSDPKQRFHTLGRLAYAVFEKGERSAQSSPGMRDYTPSWAPDITASIELDQQRITALWLADNLGSALIGSIGIVNVSFAYSNSNLVRIIGPLESGSMTKSVELGLGQELTDTRQEITDLARSFFDQYQIPVAQTAHSL